MEEGGELGGGGLPEPGWGARLRDVAAYLRALGLEVGVGSRRGANGGLMACTADGRCPSWKA